MHCNLVWQPPVGDILPGWSWRELIETRAAHLDLTPSERRVPPAPQSCRTEIDSPFLPRKAAHRARLRMLELQLCGPHPGPHVSPSSRCYKLDRMSKYPK